MISKEIILKMDHSLRALKIAIAMFKRHTKKYGKLEILIIIKELNKVKKENLFI
jgi:hypothetical protein